MGDGEGETSPTPGNVSGVRRGLRARLFAWSLAHADAQQHRLYGGRKRRLFAEVEGREGHPPVVVEIGAGAGPNARYLPTGARWVCVEPNVHFHSRLQRSADAHGLDLEVHAGTAEAIPLADGAADAVVSTLVLCSVSDVPRSLAEIRRVLRPGGLFLFVEHVAAPPGTLLRRLQHGLRRPWGWLADGCRPDRETEVAIRAAGFDAVEVERWRAPLGLAAPHIAGTARVSEHEEHGEEHLTVGGLLV